MFHSAFLGTAVLFSGLFVSAVFAHTVSETVRISITDDGFVPARVTVHKGATITWKNEGENSHWPASAVHPTHSAYPEHTSEDCLGSSFDACLGLNLGESYSFRFNTVGVWGFHDHLNARMTGVVEVIEYEDQVPTGFFSRLWIAVTAPLQWLSNLIEERFGDLENEFGISGMENGESIKSYIREQMTRCEETGGKGRCYEVVAKLVMRKHSLDEVMHEMLSAEQYPVVYSRCHELAHFLAREGYKKNKSVPESYGMCTEACWGGCYHGVMEQHFGEKGFSLGGGDDDKIAREMMVVCGVKEDFEEPKKFFECLHGLGHAMMFITNGDLPNSLRYCDMLGEVQRSETCYGGVFMENSSSSTSRDHPSSYLDPENPLYPCTILDEKYLSSCYHYQSSYFSFLTGFDWKKTSDMCEGVPSPYQKDCFGTFGSNQVGFTQDYSVMRANCALVPSEYYPKCVQGAVGAIGIRFGREPTRMLDFCSQVPDSVKMNCYSHVGYC